MNRGYLDAIAPKRSITLARHCSDRLFLSVCALGASARQRRAQKQVPVAQSAPRLRLGFQCRFCQSVELRDGDSSNPEYLSAPTPHGDPGFECGDALGAQALDER